MMSVLASVCPHPRGGAQCPGLGLSLVPQLPAPGWGGGTGPGCQLLPCCSPGSPAVPDNMCVYRSCSARYIPREKNKTGILK